MTKVDESSGLKEEEEGCLFSGVSAKEEEEGCLFSYRRNEAREVAEGVLFADGSNQHCASIQLISTRQDNSSTAAYCKTRPLLWTGGRGGEKSQRGGDRGGGERDTGREERGQKSRNKKH